MNFLALREKTNIVRTHHYKPQRTTPSPDECDTNQHKYRTKTIHHMRIQKSLNLSPKQEN
jgi:hypothetical protein